MKKLALLVVGSAVSLLLGAIPASADNGPHVAGAGIVADSCAGCHRAHTAQGSKLLKDSSQTQLCYTCHGTTGTGANNDVQDGVGYSGEGRGGGIDGALRGGGFQYALIDSANPSGQEEHYYSPLGSVPVKDAGESVSSTHSIDSSDQMMWGNGAISAEPNYGASTQLRCGSCHDPHGNGNYRILKGEPEDSGVGEAGEVNIPDADTKIYTTNNYWDFEDESSASFSENIADWCSTCHTRYLAPTDSGHTDSGDALYAYRHRSNDKGVPVGTPTCTRCHNLHGPDPEQGPPNCVQCHVAHGSNATMSGEASQVDWPDGTPAGADSRLLRIDNRGICQMCHFKTPHTEYDDIVTDSCAGCHRVHNAQEAKLLE